MNTDTTDHQYHRAVADDDPLYPCSSVAKRRGSVLLKHDTHDSDSLCKAVTTAVRGWISRILNLLATSARNSGQPLSPSVKNILAPYFPGLDLNQIRVQEGIPWYVVGNPLAYTEANRIYFRTDHYDPHTVQGLSDIAHELTHSLQYAKLGTLKFRSHYLAEYTLRRLRLDHDSAYRNISFEVQARKRAEIIQQDLSGAIDDCRLTIESRVRHS